MENNMENPFLTKIIHEAQLCENDAFGIVPDAEPMIAGHYMFYLKEWKKAVADSNPEKVALFIEKVFPGFVDNIPYAYFERGRASFCTSMNGVIHGHGHLVPRFLDDMSDFFPYGKVSTYESLEEAYRNAPKTGQYLLWGNLGECFHVLSDITQLPKRIIRHTVERHHNVEII